MTTPGPASVQGVRPTRPTPRELAAQLRQRLDITESDEALLTAAITRDREQGRAADAAEIARLREALGRIEAVGAPEGAGTLAKTIAGIARRALAAPLAPATTGKEPTK